MTAFTVDKTNLDQHLSLVYPNGPETFTLTALANFSTRFTLANFERAQGITVTEQRNKGVCMWVTICEEMSITLLGQRARGDSKSKGGKRRLWSMSPQRQCPPGHFTDHYSSETGRVAKRVTSNTSTQPPSAYCRHPWLMACLNLINSKTFFLVEV